MNYLRGGPTPRVSHQRQPIPGREAEMVPNSEGGYVFTVGPMERMRRFLVLGAEGGTYYIGERQLVQENAKAVRECLDQFGVKAVDEIVEISTAGRAPKNDEAIYALAMACAHPNDEVKRAAFEAIPAVCRIGTHLFMFMSFVEGFRGWGSGLRKAVAAWYEREDVSKIAYQAIKYRQREGWTHRDALRLAHPKAPTRTHSGLYNWICRGSLDQGDIPAAPRPHAWLTDTAMKDRELAAIEAFERAQLAPTPAATVALIKEYEGLLPREALRTEHLPSPEVQTALIEAGMPMTAMIRNLANMTRAGVVGPMGKGMTREVIARILDRDALRRGRVHPMTILFAQATYGIGRSMMGTNTWTPVTEIVDALDEAFHLAFENVEPSGKRTLLCIDVSPSMSGAIRQGVDRQGRPKHAALSCAGGAGALALVTERVEPWTAAMAFSGGNTGMGWRGRGSSALTPLTLSAKTQRVHDVTVEMDRLSRQWGSTDCSLPFTYALGEDMDVDTFVVITDAETYDGQIQPVQALRQYREAKGIDAKLVVIGMASNGFTIADPTDAGMLDVVGFDAASPRMIADFAAGRV